MDEAREDAALDALREMGFSISLHERPGTTVARMTSTDGRVKIVTGVTAQHVLEDAKSWWNWNQCSALPECRFVPGPVEVIHRVVGATAQEAARREEVRRRQIAIQNGAAEIVAEAR